MRICTSRTYPPYTCNYIAFANNYSPIPSFPSLQMALWAEVANELLTDSWKSEFRVFVLADLRPSLVPFERYWSLISRDVRCFHLSCQPEKSLLSEGLKKLFKISLRISSSLICNWPWLKRQASVKINNWMTSIG